MIDEIASGTNPTEGTALTKSLVDYLIEKPYISLITTHFESVTERDGIVNMQVRGLADCDFRLLNRQIQNANRRKPAFRRHHFTCLFFFFCSVTAFYDFINQAIRFCFFCAHEIIALCIFCNLLY